MTFSNKLLRSLAAFAAITLISGASIAPASATGSGSQSHYGESKSNHYHKSSKYDDDNEYDDDKCDKYKKYKIKYADDDKKSSKYLKYAKYCNDDGHHNGHSSKLVIQEIFVDQPSTGQMTILGTNFGTAPHVRFGTEPGHLVISSVSSANGIDSIVADLPADIPAGDYLVIVSARSPSGHGGHDDDDHDDYHQGHGNRGCDENSACADEYDLTVAAPADTGGGADPLTTRILCDVCRALNNDANPGLFLACGQFLDRAEETNACPIFQ